MVKAMQQIAGLLLQPRRHSFCRFIQNQQTRLERQRSRQRQMLLQFQRQFAAALVATLPQRRKQVVNQRRNGAVTIVLTGQQRNQ